MKKKAKAKKKRLVRGKDFDAWMWKLKDESGFSGGEYGSFDCWTTKVWPPTAQPAGKWVRVKFVEVKP